MTNGEQPEWTPDEQKLIDYIAGLDNVSRSIYAYMQLTLPLETVRKLLPLADIACRDKDPTGALVFWGIDTLSPSVECHSDARSTKVKILMGLSGSSRYVLPLRPVLALSMGRTLSKSIQ